MTSLATYLNIEASIIPVYAQSLKFKQSYLLDYE